ncbi:MAG TPA: tetratricopeptide repeat protein, partial [Chloroflexota bacterium]|nr:tetratricopeptide repeat protein [Chloroflexota bacterium]
DLRFYEGPPATLSLLALHIAPEERALSRDERLTALLAQLAQVVPDLEFGDLLPNRVVPSPVQRSEETLPPAAMQTAIAQPQCPTEEPLQSAVDGLLFQTMELARNGHSHKALRALEELLHNYPTNGPAWKLREEIRLLERREKRRQKDPRNPQTILEVGFSYLILERNRDAAEALRSAIRLDPKTHLSHLLLGIALHREGERDGAREAYLQAARLQPEADSVCNDLLRALERGEPPMPLTESNRASRPRPQPRTTFQWARAV